MTLLLCFARARSLSSPPLLRGSHKVGTKLRPKKQQHLQQVVRSVLFRCLVARAAVEAGWSVVFYTRVTGGREGLREVDELGLIGAG